MAVQPYTILTDTRHKVYCVVVQWILGSGDTGQPFDGVEFPDKCVQMSGTFGAAVTMEGCNSVTSPSNWNGLTDPTQTAISINAAGLKAILENPYWIRPNAGAVTSVTVQLVCAQSRS